MADNAIIKIMTALLKHQVKKLVGEDALGVIGQELTAIGGDKLDDQVKTWLGEKTTAEELEKAADYALNSFREKVQDDELRQWIVMMPLRDLPEVISAIEELPTSPDETKLEKALRDSISVNWKKLSKEQIENAVNAFMFSLRSALLPLEKQTLMVIGRSVLVTQEKVTRLLILVEELYKNKQEQEEKSERKLKRGWFFGHQYGDIEFTGRDEERIMLRNWLSDNKDNLLILRALGGFGKTSLAWEWLNNDVDRQKWHTAIWWSFYEKESGFDNFLDFTLSNLGIDIKEKSSRQKINDLLEVMQQTNILIVMDGFERLLRQYAGMDAIYKNGIEDEEEINNLDPSQRDCLSFDVENFLKGLSKEKLQSKVLITTRLTPRILEGKNGKLLKWCREESLDVFKEGDAVQYFKNENIKATRAEILEVSARYGFHPLSLSLLVGLINEDHDNQGDINVAKQLDIFDDIKQNRYHVLKRAFESLTLERRELLSKLSCFRGSINYDTIKKIFNTPDFDKSLIDLRQRGLIKYTDETKSYDMHPIVRHYVYDRFTDKDRRNTHFELVMHFIDVVPVTNKNLKTLEDFTPVIELYHHMVCAGNLDEAAKLFYDRLEMPTYYQFGAYQLRIELLRALFLDGTDKPPRLKSDVWQGWVFNVLANSYGVNGQPHYSVPLNEGYISISEKRGDKKETTIGLGNVAVQQLVIGALKAAERNQRRQIDLCREIADEFREAIGHQELGRVLSYRGVWQEAQENLLIAQKVFEKEGPSTNFGSVNLSYLALRDMLLLRIEPVKQEYLLSALDFCRRALKWSDDTTRMSMQVPLDYIRAYWLLGKVYRAVSIAKRSTTDELTLAEENLAKALNLCRQINAVDAEADILLEIAQLRYAQKNLEEAKSLVNEALIITESCGYVLQGADVNLFLSQYALEQEKDKVKAKEYAETALKLATCDGPPYYYKVAYHEAEALLKKIDNQK
jgi:hypothetical protein